MLTLKKSFVGVVLFGAVCSVQAAPVTLTGSNFSVTYDDALLGLFGTPSLSGNTLFFTPTNFQALSENGAGIDLVKQTANFDFFLAPDSNTRFDTVKLSEAGDYLQFGGESFADVRGQIRVRDVANPAQENVSFISPSAPLDIADGSNHDWSANTSTDLSGTEWKDTRAVRVTLENILLAYSQPGTGPQLSFVEKKFAGINVAVAPIPEPSTWLMMLGGMGVLGFIAVRRRDQF